MISHSPRSVADTRWSLHFAIVLVLLLAWRLWTLHVSGLDLYFDEAQYWAWSQEPAFGYFSKPPMIAWLIGSTTGLCGHGEACVRLGAPLLHAATSLLVFLTASRLFDRRIGFWSALVFATTPGISFSSALISTDVPLLFFWTGALLALAVLQEKRTWTAALALGLCLGLGLLSKYAMIYFVPCAAIWLLLDRPSRWLLRDARLAVILVVPAVLVAPNIAWNIDNGLVTFAHTADNANWGDDLLHPARALEFFAAQFGVFGPILFGALVWIAVTTLRGKSSRPHRMLLAFSLPILLLILLQAFLSRAHPNWAAAAYPAAAILVTEALIRDGWRRLFGLSLALHLVLQGALTYGLANAATLSLPGKIDPYWRALGWRETAAGVREALSEEAYGAVLTDSRYMAAELLYYLRDTKVPIFAFRPGQVPRDHFQLTRPYGSGDPMPVLLVSERPSRPELLAQFQTAEPVRSLAVAAGARSVRTIHMIALDDFVGEANE